jgi:plasmid replication initiation protein
MPKKKSLESQTAASNENLRKHVAAIHTSGELSLLERKMANVFLLNAYDNLLNNRTHKINVKLLATMLGWDESNNTTRLKAALEVLASTPVTFNEMKDGKESWKVMSMISFGQIENGICSYRYDEYLAERLYDPEIYATINLKIQRDIGSGYALSLHENCLRYKTVKSTGWWEIEKFRRLIGAENPHYDDFRRLNAKVIKPSVNEINKVTEIQITPEFKKEGRKVAFVRFLIKENPQQTLLNSEDLDEYVEIRKTETYLKLREHGIGERLAILWTMQDEERAKEVIDYVENKAKKKQVKGSTAGYIRKLIEENAEVGKSGFESGLELQEQKNRELIERKLKEVKIKASYEENLRERTSQVVKSLSPEEIKSYIEKYCQQDKTRTITTFSLETGKIKNTIERLSFMAWLREHIKLECE